MFLNEFEEKGYNLEPLKPYEDFLIECSEKDYGDLLTQKHHILPRCMGGNNKKENLIYLSIEDHYTAHIILAHCFNTGQKEKTQNIYGANRIVQRARFLYKEEHNVSLNKDSIDYWETINSIVKKYLSENNFNKFRIYTEEDRRKMSEAQIGKQCGEKNGMFGRNHSVESKKKMSEKLKGKAPGAKSVFYGVPMIDRLIKKYGEELGKIKFEEWKISVSIGSKGHKKSEETRRRMSLARKKPIMLLHGVFYCVENLTETQQFYRICECGKIIFYKCYGYANAAAKRNVKCLSCRHNNRKGKPSSSKGKKIGPRKNPIKKSNRNTQGENNPNFGKRRSEEWKQKHSELIRQVSVRGETHPRSKQIKDNRTGIIYFTQGQTMLALDLNRSTLFKLIEQGVLSFLKEDTNV